MGVVLPSSAVGGRARAEGPNARTRVAVAGAVGVIGALVVSIVGPWWLVPLTGWDIAAFVFLSWIWRSLWSLDETETAEQAKREDPGRPTADLLLIGASIVSLLAVGLVLVRSSHETGAAKLLLVGLAVLSVVLAWGIVHTVFSLRYARLYYAGRPGGVDFNEETAPRYTDFAYLALTIGMTFQVSDTDLTTKDIRRTALRHAMLSYTFGALIIALTINLIAGLSK
jgi:uncharacterized membrane protein